MMVGRVLLATALVVTFAVPAGAATTTVAVGSGGLRFDPAKITRRAGATVTWEKRGGFHNVASTTGMFRSGDGTAARFSFTRTFSAGTFPYRCEVHASEMKGRVRVRPRVSAAPAGLPFTVRWATAATNTGTSFRVQYRSGSGRWRTWLARTASPRAVFGAGGSPERVVAGRRYSFRVRSMSGRNASRYSPPRSFVP